MIPTLCSSFFILFSLCFMPFAVAVELKRTTATKKQELNDKVNINLASVDEIAKKLRGIGIEKAKLIVEYREKYGPFIVIEQLAEVKGVGVSIVDKNKDVLLL